MGKQTRPRKGENIGKGKVTPIQVAFIVDRFLSDNNFSLTRSSFRTEASHLISKSPTQEAPKSLLSLGAMLDEYICLKEQKVILDEEKYRLEQEKIRVQTLLKGMHDVMNAYNGSALGAPSLLRPPMVVPHPGAKTHHVDISVASPSVYTAQGTPVVMSTTRPSNIPTDSSNFSSPITNQLPSRKRKNVKESSVVPEVSAALLNSKKSRCQTQTNKLPTRSTKKLAEPSNASVNQESALQSSAGTSPTNAIAPTGSPVQGSSVAKCLFNQTTQSPPPTSSDPKTPSPSQSDKPVSPPDNLTPNSHTVMVTPQQFTSTNRTVISSETIRVSPTKQISYYSIERNHCVSSSPIKTNLTRFSKRDHVKGRLDFDGSNMSISCGNPVSEQSVSVSQKEAEIFDFDLPNLDALGVNFSLSELLGDFDLEGVETDYYCQPAASSSPESLSGSPDTPFDANMSENQIISGFSSVTEILSEKDMNLPGSDSVTSMKSITKCMKILSPEKNQRSPCQGQENITSRN